MRFGEITFFTVGIFLILLVSSLIGKFVGAYLPLRIFSKEIAKYGVFLFNYRLSFRLITAIYGLKKVIRTVELFNTILLCVLFSSLTVTYGEKRLNAKNSWPSVNPDVEK